VSFWMRRIGLGGLAVTLNRQVGEYVRSYHGGPMYPDVWIVRCLRGNGFSQRSVKELLSMPCW
jgi:hypothetical protein